MSFSFTLQMHATKKSLLLVSSIIEETMGEASFREDMRGRSAAVHVAGTAADFAFRLGLKTAGLNIKDVKTVMVGGSSPRIAAVKSGQLDFTVVTGSGKVEGEKPGLKVIVDMAKIEFAFSVHMYDCDRKNDP